MAIKTERNIQPSNKFYIFKNLLLILFFDQRRCYQITLLLKEWFNLNFIQPNFIVNSHKTISKKRQKNSKKKCQIGLKEIFKIVFDAIDDAEQEP